MLMSIVFVWEDPRWMSLSWFIDGIITWRKSKTKIFLFYVSFKLIGFGFFVSFKLEKELQKDHTGCRFTMQFKVIHTEKVKSYPFFKSVFETSILDLIKILQKGRVLLQHILFFSHMFMKNLDAVRSTFFPITSANTRYSFSYSLFPSLP